MGFHILFLSLVLAADPPSPEEWFRPPASDMKRMPTLSQVNDAIDLNLTFQRWCLTHQSLEPARWEAYEEMRIDAIWREKCWEHIRQAWYHYGADGKYSKRHYLNMLREEIGDEAYSFGYMPHPLPLWAFARD